MPFLYGATDEKHVKLESTLKKKKLKPLDTFKFSLNSLLQGKQKRNRYETSIHFKTSPDTLVEVCSSVVDSSPLPDALYWNTCEVADWIRKLGFPQYQNTFKKNLINGRSLVRLDASYLVKMNIKTFDHLKLITDSIRKLYGLHKSSSIRSISFPDRAPNDLYNFFHTRTGPKYEKVRRSDLYRKRSLLRPRSLYENHWQSLEKWLNHSDPNETELFGGTHREKNALYRSKMQKPLMVMPKKKSYHKCSGIPPCMCDWTKERDLKNPWRLKCLEKKIHQEEFIYYYPCACSGDQSASGYQKGFTLLKENVPRKYATTPRISIDRSARARSSVI